MVARSWSEVDKEAWQVKLIDGVCAHLSGLCEEQTGQGMSEQ